MCPWMVQVRPIRNIDQLSALKEKADEAATAMEQLHTFLSLTVNEQQLTPVKELALNNRHNIMMAELVR